MMLEAADRWFAAQLAALPASALSPCCDIGSGVVSAAPGGTQLRDRLIERGARLVNFDRKIAPGIDISGDIFDPADNRQLARLNARLIICTNVIEHIPGERIGEFARILSDCLAGGGYLFISAPRSHPYHLDPIDNMYRPGPEELAGLFPDLNVLAAAVAVGPTYWHELKHAAPGYSWRMTRRLLKPFRNFQRWKATAHRFGWLWRPYQETCLVLHKSNVM
jgi:hypothetical protein